LSRNYEKTGNIDMLLRIKHPARIKCQAAADMTLKFVSLLMPVPAMIGTGYRSGLRPRSKTAGFFQFNVDK